MAQPPKIGADRTLADLGELKLIDDIIVPIAKRYQPGAPLGDDCAIVEVGGLKLAVSADVGPRPAIQSLAGHENDYAAAGWHAVVATASDIATAGAKPLFMTNCIDAPPDLSVETLRTFVDAMFHAYDAFGFSNAGGDIRHGPTLHARITGVGVVEHASNVGRSGAAPGDIVVLIGHPGRFMSAFLTALTHGSETLRADQLEWLRFPRPALLEMIALCGANLITAASDSSDGVLGAIDNIARGSGVGFELDLRDDEHLDDDIRAAASSYAADPWNIFFCWGDWSITATVRQQAFVAFEELARRNSILFTRLGTITADTTDTSKIIAKHGNKRRVVTVVRNENFLSRGFNAGITGHLDYMLKTPLFGDQVPPND